MSQYKSEHTGKKILQGTRVAVLISDGFELSEFEGPVYELRQAGAQVDVLAQNSRQMMEGIQGFSHLAPGRKVKSDRLIADAAMEEYDGLLIPGGVLSVDQMRESHYHTALVTNFMESEKPIAVICHGGWVLADAGVLRGRTMTSWPGIRKDLERAGAIWKDQEVLEDGNLISSRKPEDVSAFTAVFIGQLVKHSVKNTRAA